MQVLNHCRVLIFLIHPTFFLLFMYVKQHHSPSNYVFLLYFACWEILTLSRLYNLYFVKSQRMKILTWWRSTRQLKNCSRYSYSAVHWTKAFHILCKLNDSSSLQNRSTIIILASCCCCVSAYVKCPTLGHEIVYLLIEGSGFSSHWVCGLFSQVPFLYRRQFHIAFIQFFPGLKDKSVVDWRWPALTIQWRVWNTRIFVFMT
jgi:hypothetical protein